MAFLTVFTPAYNRAHTLQRTYESLCRQECKDFLWLIIDDGSTDQTSELVQSWQKKENGFEIQYIYKENGGMHTAHNTAYENIHTELNVCIDSDDWIAPGAVKKIRDTWEKVRDKGYAGMIALDADFSGNIIGKGFPAGMADTTLGGYYAAGGSGDKKLIYRTDVINSVPPYPVFPGEKYVGLVYKYILVDQKYKLIVKERYDIEVAYLEGPCARVISGCNDPGVKKVAWIHIEQHTAERAAESFRSVMEAKACYQRFDRIICVSQTVKQDFLQTLQIPVPHEVLYNTNESDRILCLSNEAVNPEIMFPDEIKLVGVGKLLKSKGFDRIVRIVKRLKEQGYPVHFYVLGEGPERNSLQKYIQQNRLEDSITLLGYQLNPYKFVAKCDLFICASYAEGFSTAATEALILGTPVCTVEVSGMKEMLGENNEYGLVVENRDEALYQGIRRFFEVPGLLEHYAKQAEIRGKDFSTEKTVRKVEKMLMSI